MPTLLNGREAISIIAQLLNERVHVHDSTQPQFIENNNVWNNSVKVIYKDAQFFEFSFPLTTAILSSASLVNTIPFLHELKSSHSSIVFHVAANYIKQPNAFSDFTQVMSLGQMGIALLCSSTVQEAYDFSLMSYYIARSISTPFIHFFDSSRISDEYTSIQLLDHISLLDLFDQIPPHQDVSDAFQSISTQLTTLTGRSYSSMEYKGHPQAQCVIVSMGAAATVIEQTLMAMDQDLKLGAIKISLYRPWSSQTLLELLPKTVERIAVLEPSHDNTWNPLFLDIVAAYQSIPQVDIFSGQYGIQELDFSPHHVVAVFENLLDNRLDSFFLISDLPTEHHLELTIVPDHVDQFIFIGKDHYSLATTYAARQEQAQIYSVDGTSHVRVSKEPLTGPFLPSLIQDADMLVLLDYHDNYTIMLALERLKVGGYIMIQDDLNLLESNIKKAAFLKQVQLIPVRDITETLHCKMDLFNQTIPVPEAWSIEPHEPFIHVQKSTVTSPSPPSAAAAVATLSVETNYIKMLDQIFGTRLNIANAFHSRSIWSPNNDTQSNAATPEFGYGRLVALEQDQKRLVHHVIQQIQSQQLSLHVIRVLSQWVLRINSSQPQSQKIKEAADLVIQVLNHVPEAQNILSQKHLLYLSSNWLIGSDQWAIDLGDSGIHHVITSGENINLLIIDTGSNERRKKDIGLYAMNFGSVYVASVALYASYTGVLQAMMEADAYPGPAIVLAYLPQGDPLVALKETKIAVDNGHWPLYRWHPNKEPMFQLDSTRIKKQLEEFLDRENLLSQLVSSQPDISTSLYSSLEHDIKKRHKEIQSKARLDYARLLSGLSANHPPLTILFGSDNGNSETLAKRIATRAQIYGFQVKWMAMDDYQDDLASETNLVIICSTAGQGEMPSNARTFWKTLKALIVGDFTDLHFAVFGLGDSHYWPRPQDVQFYNRPGKLIDAKLETLGATRLLPLGLGDDQDEDGFETGFSTWLPALWKCLGVQNMNQNEKEPEYTEDQMKLDSNYLRGEIAQELSDYSTTHVTENTSKLLKFHGTHLYDDLDLRQERESKGLEKAYSFLVRVRTSGGVATPKQWLVMDTLSERYANKSLKLTTRQSFQLHGVLKKNLRTTIRQINKTLLSTLGACGDVNRNIMCTSLTHVPDIHNQVQKLAVDLKNLLTPQTTAYHEIWLDNSMVAGHAVQDTEPIYGPNYLPSKFKIAIAVPPSNDVDVYAHDLGFIAILDHEKVIGYNVLIGGGMGQTIGNKKTYPRVASLVGYIPANSVLEVTKAIVLLHRDHSDRVDRKRARFKYTVDRLGLDFIKKEIETKCCIVFQEAKPFEFKDNADQYGWTKGVSDTWNFTMFIENGRIKDTPDFRCKTGLRELAKFHKGEFRLTPNQNLVIANISQEDLEKTKAHLTQYNMDNTSFSGIRKSSMACVALPTCGLALAESERYLPRLISLLEQVMEEAGLGDDAIVIRMTGCPSGCSRPYLAELGFVGNAPDTYNIYLGGSRNGERLNKLYKENMQEVDILKEMSSIIKKYALERQNDESFGDWVIRTGYI